MEIIVDTQMRIGEDGAYTAFIDFNGNEVILKEITFGYKPNFYDLNYPNPVINARCKFQGNCNLETTNEDGTVGLALRNILTNTLNQNWYLVTDEELENMFEETDIPAT
tara:strand:- start:3144 stop:3470 length:327 start_codon:yes stop_codon:yes gene_type:complete